MQLISQAFVSCLPFMLIFFIGRMFFFCWVSVVLVKVYKDDAYSCQNAKPNLSSMLEAVLALVSICSMEDLAPQMAALMDLNGKDNAPKYNANEHIQILVVIGYLVGGVLALNFIASTVMLNYRRVKEELSGEKGLTHAVKEWLRIQNYILSLHPEQPERLPDNCVRRLLHQICTHRTYKVVQGIFMVSFLIVSALCRVGIQTDSQNRYWWGVSFYILLFLLDFLMNLVAFGCRPKQRNSLILDALICLCLIAAYSLRQSKNTSEGQSDGLRMISGAVILLLPLTSIRCNFLAIQCSIRFPPHRRSPGLSSAYCLALVSSSSLLLPCSSFTL